MNPLKAKIYPNMYHYSTLSHIFCKFQEYENQTSPEANFAKDLDRYDMILQAFEYEKRENTPQKLQEFFTATEGKFKHPFIQDLVKELYRQREEFEKQSLMNGTAV